MKQFGCTRQVYLLGPLAIKFPVFSDVEHFLKGLLHNYIEGKRYKGFKEVDMAKVYFTGPFGIFLVMERLETKEYTQKQWEMEESRLADKFCHAWYISDIKPDNFGVNYLGHEKCLDYGEI